jgi:hypothetical protein
VVHGIFLLVGIITAVALVLFMAPAGVVGGAFLAAALVGAVASAMLALDLPRRGAELVAAAVRLDPGPGPLIAGVAVGALLLGLVGLLVGLRAGAPVQSLVGGAILGAAIGGFLGGMSFSAPGGIAFGVAVALAAWPVFQLGLASRAGVSPMTRFERLKPHQTIETAQETRAWLEAEWTKRREGLTKR